MGVKVPPWLNFWELSQEGHHCIKIRVPPGSIPKNLPRRNLAVVLKTTIFYCVRYATVIIHSPRVGGSTSSGRPDHCAAEGGDFLTKNKVEGLSPST